MGVAAVQRKKYSLRERASAKSGKLASDAPQKYEAPPFTLKHVRDAIPAHCFKRNTARSFLYVLHDAVLVALLFYAATCFRHLPAPLACVAWPLYWLCQGVVLTGVWVIAHECGHGAFSPHTWVNNLVGYILHTALLVPYYSWKYTHSKHHKGTGHMDRDQVFLPYLRSDITGKIEHVPADEDGDDSLTEVAPIIVIYEIVRMVVFGWPAYILFNASGQRYPGWNSHFNPYSAMFDKKQFYGVVASTVGFLGFCAFLVYMGQIYGSIAVIAYYVIPYLGVNFWLVTITFLQHTDPKLPHYSSKEWDFLKGALATVDRDYGILNHFHHHIADTHIAHHLFSQMPHYHAQEATEAIKTVLGKYYLYDDTNIFVSLYRSQAICRFVENDGDRLWYKY